MATDRSTSRFDVSSCCWRYDERPPMPSGCSKSRSCTGPSSSTPGTRMRATENVPQGVPMIAAKNSPALMRAISAS
eukprot:3517191-Prymnesium_polylepis.1